MAKNRILGRIHADCASDLAQIVDALDRISFFRHATKHRDGDGGENGKDGNNHEKLDQGESPEAPPPRSKPSRWMKRNQRPGGGRSHKTNKAPFSF